MLDARCLMLDREKNIHYYIQYPRPLPSSGFRIPEFRRIGNSPEGEADGGQAETSI